MWPNGSGCRRRCRRWRSKPGRGTEGRATVMTHPRTLEELGWPEILAALAGRCRLPAGRARALTLPFQPDAAAVREALARVGEARSLSEAAWSLPLGGVSDVEPHLERAG